MAAEAEAAAARGRNKHPTQRMNIGAPSHSSYNRRDEANPNPRAAPRVPRSAGGGQRRAPAGTVAQRQGSAPRPFSAKGRAERTPNVIPAGWAELLRQEELARQQAAGGAVPPAAAPPAAAPPVAGQQRRPIIR